MIARSRTVHTRVVCVTHTGGGASDVLAMDVLIS